MAEEKRSLLQAYRAAKAESGISMRRVLATALAAVTMALISSRLTSVLNSLMLVAVVSIGSALIGEAYRIVLSVTAEGTKKVAETTKKVIVPIVHHEALVGHDDETRVLDVDAIDKTKVLEAAKEAELIEEVTTEVTTEPLHEDPQADQAGKSPLRTNQFVQLALIFGVVSLITVGISYAVARSQGQTDITYNYSAAAQHPLEALTPEQQQVLANLAIAADPSGQSEGGTTPPPDAEGSGAAAGESESEAPAAPSDLASIQTELADLSTQNESLHSVIEELRSELHNETRKTDELTARIAELEALVAQLEAAPTAPVTPESQLEETG